MRSKKMLHLSNRRKAWKSAYHAQLLKRAQQSTKSRPQVCAVHMPSMSVRGVARWWAEGACPPVVAKISFFTQEFENFDQKYGSAPLSQNFGDSWLRPCCQSPRTAPSY